MAAHVFPEWECAFGQRLTERAQRMPVVGVAGWGVSGLGLAWRCGVPRRMRHKACSEACRMTPLAAGRMRFVVCC